MPEPIEIDQHGTVGVLYLSRPDQRNALSAELCDRVHETLTAWAADPTVAAAVLTGRGAAFSAGFDLAEVADPAQQHQLVAASSRYHRTVWNFPKPVVCAVNGPALAGGFDLTTLCDIRVAADTAYFGHPETQFGMPPLYTPLRWIVGDGRARDLCLTSRTIDAPTALRYGLISGHHPEHQLMARAVDIAETVARVPAPTLAMFKHYAAGAAGTFEVAFRAEHDEPFARILGGQGADVASGGAQRLDALRAVRGRVGDR